jgi:enterochelin esterase-like enzyme
MPIHRLLALARLTGNPIIEGDIATLIWQGQTSPLVMDDLHNWDDSPQKMQRIGTALWSFSISLPADAYLEYAFIDKQSGERIPDPLNSNLIGNGMDGFNNFFYMPSARPSPFIHHRKGIPRGKVTKHHVPTQDFAVGYERTIYLYDPPVEEPVPLVIVYDGQDYLRRGKLNIIVDNMIAVNQIRPIAMALIHNGGQARTLEYSCSEPTLGLLTECILPLAREHLSLLPPEEAPYGVIGASLGGLMALFTGLRIPSIFGKVLSQSGAFGTPEYEFAIVDLIRYAPRPEIRVWMDTGCLEWLLEGNRKMYALLRKKNYNVSYHEYSAGHNYTAWRNDIWLGLEHLFGGK